MCEDEDDDFDLSQIKHTKYLFGDEEWWQFAIRIYLGYEVNYGYWHWNKWYIVTPHFYIGWVKTSHKSPLFMVCHGDGRNEE